MKRHFDCLLVATLMLLGAALAPSTRAAADTIQQDIVMDMDRLGDGTLTITFRLSASQWTIWKQQYGDRPDVLWRDLQQQFSALALGEFSLEKNEVERIVTAKIKVRGGTKLRSDGAQEIDIPKDMKKISASDGEWIFTSINQEAVGAPILTTTTHVRLPKEAMNVRLNQPGTAFQALVYEIPGTSSGRAMLVAGITMVVLGLGLGVAGFLPGKSRATGAAA